MIFGSVCSGMEAASVAWKPLGWRCAFTAENDKAPSALLKQRYPDVPNYGDITKFKDWPDHAIDLLVGGTPCQSFSVAGLRKGLTDPRGSLMLIYGAIAQRYRPAWLLWENVPGVLSSNGGRDFGSFLGMLAELGYGFAYRVLDAQFFGLAQRRARVFVVGYLGDWRPPAAVLFERESLRGDSPPRRETGQGIAHELAPSLTSSGRGVERPGESRGQDPVIPIALARCVTAREGGRYDGESTTLIAHALRADGFDASEDGTGRGTPLVPVAFSSKDHGADAGEIAPTLRAMGHDGSHANAGGQVAIAFQTRGSNLDVGHISGTIGTNADRASGSAPMIAHAFDARQSDVIQYGDKTGPLDTDGQSVAVAIQAGVTRENPNSGPDGVGVQEGIAYTLEARAEVQAVAFAENSRAELRLEGGDGATISSLKVGGGKPGQSYPAIAESFAVRRLTPIECERLQGFPDGHSLVPYRGKPMADGPRYKMLGNSFAVPVVRWLGERIDLVARALKDEAA